MNGTVGLLIRLSICCIAFFRFWSAEVVEKEACGVDVGADVVVVVGRPRREAVIDGAVEKIVAAGRNKELRKPWAIEASSGESVFRIVCTATPLQPCRSTVGSMIDRSASCFGQVRRRC